VLQTGDILVGRYELGSLLGRGGMSSVFTAFDRRLGREVAIKVLAAGLADDGTFVERFEREARAAASLSHRNVVAVFDTGAEDGTRFIVMERASGTTLSSLLREGPLPVEQAVQIAVSVAQALGAAHARGIVHRDVKPGNVMVGPDGQVKVLDFGIARALAATSLTGASTVIGTAGYLSPEQAEGGRVDARSDLYGLGCVLHEMLTGRPPFVADSAAALVHQHLTRPPQPPSRRRPELPAALDQIVLRCLAKDPGDRYEHAEQLCGALASVPLGASRSTAAPRERTTRVLPARAAPRAAPAAGSPLSLAGKGRGRRRRIVAPAALVLLVGLVLVLALGRGSGGSPATSTARTPAGGAPHASATDPKRAARDASARASSSPSRPASSPRTSSAQSSPGPTSGGVAPAVAAAALSRLLLTDEQQGLIDGQAARAISRRSEALLRALAAGDPTETSQQLAQLAGRVDALIEEGAVATPAAAALRGATATLVNAAMSASASNRTASPPTAPAGTGENPAPGKGDRGRGHRHDGGGEGSQD
jgi:serine/threonine-protein kinase